MDIRSHNANLDTHAYVHTCNCCNCDSVHYLYCTVVTVTAHDSDTDRQPCSLLYSMHTGTVRPTVTLSLSVSGPVSVGDVVMFTCTASGGVPSEYSFRWFNGSVEVMSGDSVGITSDGSTSTLMLMVRPADFVNYTCSVNNTFTETSDSNLLMEACE